MKHPAFSFCAALLLALAACNQPSTQNEAPAKTEEASASKEASAPMDSVAMMKAWEAYMAPGEMHALLAKFDGEWNEEVTMWMTPEAPPMTSTAIAVNKMVLGGRYQESRHTGTFNGMPFEGIGTLAYDNAKKKFVSSWIDNMGSGIMVVEGPWDAAAQTMTLTGSQNDPITGQDTDIRETMKIVDDNNQVMEMFVTPAGGKEYKTMEIKFARKQPS